MIKALPIRLRLTLWYCAIFGLLLTVITVTIYMNHIVSHYRQIDQVLEDDFIHLQKDLQSIGDFYPSPAEPIFTDEIYVGNVNILLLDSYGNEVYSNSNLFSSLPKGGREEQIGLQTVAGPDGDRYRILIKPIQYNGEGMGRVQMAVNLAPVDFSLLTFGIFIILITLSGLVLAAIAGWFLAKKALSRVEMIRQTASAISASQDFHQRVLHIGPMDELGELSKTFNEMLSSLEKAYMSQKRFLADASHELRAPLTTIRGNLDILQKWERIPWDEQQEILQDMRKEAIRMSKMVAELLSLARADAGQELQMQPIDLSLMIEEVKGEVQAWQKNQEYSFHAKPLMKTWGDPDSLKQLLLILVDNAVRYTPHEGRVTVQGLEERQAILLRITDSGIGIETQDLPFIFDRFYRSQEARLYSPDGTGLGLSIAKWIIDQHRGSISVTSKSGKGTEFEIRLPKIK